jgi:putative membrane protein
MRKHTCLVTAVAAVTLSFAGAAMSLQTGNPAGANPNTPRIRTGTPPEEFANTVDILFLQELALGGMAEVDFGKLAGERAQSEAVKNFAARMVKDHGAANDKVIALARANKVETPKDLDPEHQAARDTLRGASGAEFDKRYIENQIKAHQRAVQLLTHEVGSGQDVRVKAFAGETLPTVMHHLEMARSVHAQLANEAQPRDRETAAAQ